MRTALWSPDTASRAQSITRGNAVDSDTLGTQLRSQGVRQCHQRSFADCIHGDWRNRSVGCV